MCDLGKACYCAAMGTHPILTDSPDKKLNVFSLTLDHGFHGFETMAAGAHN